MSETESINLDISDNYSSSYSIEDSKEDNKEDYNEYNNEYNNTNSNIIIDEDSSGKKYKKNTKNKGNKDKKKSKSKKNDNTQYIYVIKDNSDMPTNNIISSNMKRRPRYDDDYLEYEEIREIEYDRYTRSDHDQYKLYNNTFIDDLEPATL